LRNIFFLIETKLEMAQNAHFFCTRAKQESDNDERAGAKIRQQRAVWAGREIANSRGARACPRLTFSFL
jgi:hypothetical protein